MDQLPKEIIEIEGPFVDLEYAEFENSVFISTIQKIQYMQKHEIEQFELLRQQVSLLMFDEGHYEPARKWSQLIRQFQGPRILFTATPYRNDLKVFDIDLDHVYSYTYQDAVRDNYLREAEIINRANIHDPEEFIDDVLSFYDERVGNDLQERARVIIRCDNRTEIRQLATILRRHQRRYIAIHEAFSDYDDQPFERKSVPDPNENESVFWIHQFKLLEGIDDSRFQLLAIYEPFRSARPLIQQIGRVIRNPQRDANIKGFILDHSDGLHNELWEGFLEYDAAISEHEGLQLAIGNSWLPSLLQSQPGATYIDGRFRSKLDLDSLLPESELLFPKQVNLLQKLIDFDLDGFCDWLYGMYEEKDRICRRYDVSENTVIFVYIDFQHSRFLESTTFVEPKLGVSFICEFTNIIAFFDSQGYVPINEDSLGVGKAIHPEDMKRLFRDNPGGYLTHVSLRNTNLSTRSIRSRSISAAMIHDTVSAFDDHAQVCTTATGYSIDDPELNIRERRYLGFQRGRISQSAGKWLSFNEYLDWIQSLVNMLNAAGESLFTFHRYAPEQVDIDNPNPIHILLDLYEVEDKFVTLESDGLESDQVLDIPDKACEITAGRFELIANGIECGVNISYDSSKNKYEIRSPDLDRIYKSNDPQNKKGLIDYLNREQSFRIIPESENVIYVLAVCRRTN